MYRGRAFPIVIFFALAAILAGCSTDGDITIVNNSATAFHGNLEGTGFVIEPGESHTQNVYVGKTFGFIGPSEYDVILYGSAWTVRPFKDIVTAKSGDNFSYTINDDAGALYLVNNYTTTINEISIKRCGEPEYGENLLPMGKYLSPGFGFLLQLDTGCWDIKVIYGKDDLPSYVSNQDVVIGQSAYLYWIP